MHLNFHWKAVGLVLLTSVLAACSTPSQYRLSNSDSPEIISSHSAATSEALAKYSDITNQEIKAGNIGDDSSQKDIAYLKNLPLLLEGSPRQKIIDAAIYQIGTPYQKGGSSPTGFDCSGLVVYSYQTINMTVSHHAASLYQTSKHIQIEKAEPGDLIFFSTGTKKKKTMHVAIYLGNGYIVHAPSAGQNVRIASLSNTYWQSHYLGAAKILKTDGADS